jgi:hypothetical protein
MKNTEDKKRKFDNDFLLSQIKIVLDHQEEYSCVRSEDEDYVVNLIKQYLNNTQGCNYGVYEKASNNSSFDLGFLYEK